MSEQEISKAGELEDSLGLGKAEISEVTITGMRKKLPTWLSVSLGVVGAGMTVYNGRNLYMNFKQDGKLIREAIKTKKVEENKIRDELKKKSPVAPETKSKTEQPSSSGQEKSEVKKEVKVPVNNNGNNLPQNKKQEQATSPSSNGKAHAPAVNSSNDKPVKPTNGSEIIFKKTHISNESNIQEGNIIESVKKEGEEIIATITEENKVESPLTIEATIVPIEAIPLETNGNRKIIG